VLTNLQGLSKQYEKPSTKELDARDTVEQQHWRSPSRGLIYAIGVATPYIVYMQIKFAKQNV
jgi:hypothetical protein